MTLLYIDGFDALTGAYAALRGWSGSSIAAGTGRIAGRALTSTFGVAWTLTGPSFGNKATIGVGFAHIRSSLPGSALTIFSLYDTANTTEQCGVRINTDGTLSACRGNQAAVLGTTAAPIIGDGAWHYIEVMTTIHDSTGSMEIRVDGVQVLNVTGVDTKQGTAAQADRVRFYGTANTSDRYDDLYILDNAGSVNNALLGDCRVLTCRAASDASVQWSRSTGSTNYTLVDDDTVSTSDYVHTTTAGHIDRYGLADLSYTPTNVYGVALNYGHQKADAGARTIRGFLKSGSTTSNDSAVSPALSTEAVRFALWETDPNTGAAWGASAVNALEAGVEVVT